MRVVPEEIGQVEDVQLRDERGEERITRHDHVNRPEAHPVQNLGIIAELPGRKHLHLDPVLGLRCHPPGKLLRHQMNRVLRVQRVGEPQLHLGIGRLGRGEQHAD